MLQKIVWKKFALCLWLCMLCGGVFVCCHTVFFLLISDGLIVIVTDKFLHALTDFLCFQRLSLSLSIPALISFLSPQPHVFILPQMPNTVQRQSSALRLGPAATPCPRALDPHWITVLMTQQGSSKAHGLQGRKHWSWSNAESKTRGRRTAGRMISR